MGYELELLESMDEVPRELFSELEGPEAFPFLRWEFLRAFEVSGTLGAERGWIPRHIRIRRSSNSGRGETVAFAPAYLKLHSMGEFVFDQGWADAAERQLGLRYYPKLILAVPFTPATGPRVLFQKELSAAERAEIFDLLSSALPELGSRLGLSGVHILFPDKASALAFEERRWALRLGVQFQFQNQGYSNFDEFLGSFRAKRRAAIRRECRHLEDSDLSVEVLTGSQLARVEPRLVHSLYLTTVDKYVWGRRYLSEAFFEQILREMPEGLQLVLARRPGGPRDGVIAGAFNLVGEEAIYGRYWGAFEDEPFLHFNLCLYRGIAETVRLGRQRFEPGAGGEHKESRGFSPTLTHSVHYLADARLDHAVRDFLERERESALERVGFSPEAER